MTLQDFLRHTKPTSSNPHLRSETEILLAYVLKRDRTWIIAHPEIKLPATIQRRLKSLIARRKKHEPLAYLTGQKEFFGRSFEVNQATLIPRPESEMLVELGLKTISNNVIERSQQTTKQSFRKIATSFTRFIPRDDKMIWDVGTGSGALGITMALERPEMTVMATDISTKALTVAKKNARRLKAKKIIFQKADLLDDKVQKILQRLKPQHLIILANLPYLPNKDKKNLQPDVVRYEPSSALFAGTDGLDVIKKFLKQISSLCHPVEKRDPFGWIPAFAGTTTTILLEFDPPQASTLRAFAKKCFPTSTIAIHKDLAGRQRVLEINI